MGGVIIAPTSAHAQVVVRYGGGFYRPYRHWVWRVGVGWVLIAAPPVYVYRYAAPPPPPPAPPAPPQQECPCDPEQAPAPESPPVVPPQTLNAPAPAPEGYVIRQRRPSETHLGLGVAASGFSWTGSEEGGGVAHLRIRSSGHVTWEFALGVLGGKDEAGISRHDVPATVGLYLYPWNSTLAPYFVAAGGGNFVHEDFKGAKLDASQIMGALGGGLELRLGQHFTVGADLRYEWRGVTDRRNQAPAGSPLPPIGDEEGPSYNLTGTFYF